MSDQSEIDSRIEEIRTFYDCGCGTCDNVRILIAQLDAARADTARLDWLVRNTCDELPNDWPECYASLDFWKGEWVVMDCRGQSYEHKEMGKGNTYREAIDSAMSTGETPPGSEGEGE